MKKDLSSAKQDIVVKDIRPPMPGELKKIHVKPGDNVKKGGAIALMEALKVDITIEAPEDGKITEIININSVLTVTSGDVIAKYIPM